MITLHITDEISPLTAVILGTAKSNGPMPKLEDAYDPKSAEHIKAGTYPSEEAMVREMEGVVDVLSKHGVHVFRPHTLENYNQIFARDISFVIENKIIIANILPDREREVDATEHVWSHVEKSFRVILPDDCHVEGGDVMPWGDYIFVGTYRGDDYADYITARTNMEAVEALEQLFPHKIVKSFNLRKSNTNAKENALHLDCCFQPLGKGKAIIHKESFLEEEEYEWLVNFFGKENCFNISTDEMARMYSNIFSISPDVVISEKNFTRLNDWLRSEGFTVEEVAYGEIAKQGGLLRCSTMPLVRE
ncbi:MAG: amidinotransferase [Bacteroidia bacterium]|nr:amidinotransferase [Bacteroidia bacterium]NNF31639.1 amidinotransferase [Flavobacteriaceae bacterium]MBT8275088.1 amidinotransferase [Bacteroidia bacterium]NNJ81256.1 amidinotransferase [Flavobacteriaceae bacterium]NNK53398.1 amidinotransferase [Flavobacteriaceae bacterium]